MEDLRRWITSINVCWILPPEGWVKLNTNGSALGVLCRAGASRLLQDKKGNWVRGFARYLRVTNSEVAKLSAIRDGLSLALRLGIQCIKVEPDTKPIIDLIWGPSDVNLKLRPIISDCRILLQEFH